MAAAATDVFVATTALPCLPRGVSEDSILADPTSLPPGADYPDDVRVEEYISVLERFRLLCEAEGRYAEAGLALEQITSLRREEEVRRIASHKARHAAERAALADAHTVQFAAFQAEWAAFLAGFDDAVGRQLVATRARHVTELKDYQDAAHAELLRTPLKFSRELLEWRAREASLAGLRKFTDAAHIRGVADDVERRERAKWDGERLAAHAAREDRFIAQQGAELAAIAERVGAKRAEHVKARDADAARLAQRNKNVAAVVAHRHVGEEEAFALAVRVALAPRAVLRGRRELGAVGGAGVGAGAATGVEIEGWRRVQGGGGGRTAPAALRRPKS